MTAQREIYARINLVVVQRFLRAAARCHQDSPKVKAFCWGKYTKLALVCYLSIGYSIKDWWCSGHHYDELRSQISA
ncbi:hypothetical protein TIFTF001_033820 [Ficus carica]|uniref:Uncharacterized protein n=1 Tax=Ficus carica TaxID=3494 RepID=A0AA88J4B1_FICCA|nr:hypothetical protein TIFTF001_033820 [Ficus carica]